MLSLYSELIKIPSDKKTFWDKATTPILVIMYSVTVTISILLIISIIKDFCCRNWEAPSVILSRICSYF